MKHLFAIVFLLLSINQLFGQSKLTNAAGSTLVGQFQSAKTIITASANSTQELSIRLKKSHKRYFISKPKEKLSKTNSASKQYTLSKQSQHFLTFDLGIANNKSTKIDKSFLRSLNPSVGYTYSLVPLTFDTAWNKTTTRWAKYFSISPRFGFGQVSQLDTTTASSLDPMNRAILNASVQASFLFLPLIKRLTRNGKRTPSTFLSGNIGLQTFTNASETPKYVNDITLTRLGPIGQASNFEGFIGEIETDLKLSINAYIPYLISLKESLPINQLAIGLYYQYEIGVTTTIEKNWRFGPIISFSPEQLKYGSKFKVPGSIGIGTEFREDSNPVLFLTGSFSL